MLGYVSINGEIKTIEEAVIPILDRGFLFGDGIFETLVCFKDNILTLQDHLRRLRQSAADLGFSIPWSDEQLTFELEALSSQLEAPKKILRLVITRGSGLGLKPSPDLVPNRYLFVMSAVDPVAKFYHQGIELKRKVKSFTERKSMPKTNNYLASILAIQQAESEGYDDILWTNSAGEITESSIANIFFIGRHGDLVEIVTPPVNSGILKGTTRSLIMELLTNAKIRVDEKIVFADELPRFDEAFLSSSVRGLIPVTKIDKQVLHTTRPNAVFHHIRRLFNTWFETQISEKLDWNTGEPL